MSNVKKYIRWERISDTELRITDQSHRENEFAIDGSAIFRCVDGFILTSATCPVFCGDGDELFVRGDDGIGDDKIITSSEINVDKAIKAFQEYNEYFKGEEEEEEKTIGRCENCKQPCYEGNAPDSIGGHPFYLFCSDACSVKWHEKSLPKPDPEPENDEDWQLYQGLKVEPFPDADETIKSAITILRKEEHDLLNKMHELFEELKSVEKEMNVIKDKIIKLLEV